MTLHHISFRFELKIPFHQAANLVAVRAIIEDLIINAAENPNECISANEAAEGPHALIRMLSKSDAGSYMVQQQGYGKDGPTDYGSGQNQGGYQSNGGYATRGRGWVSILFCIIFLYFLLNNPVKKIKQTKKKLKSEIPFLSLLPKKIQILG